MDSSLKGDLCLPVLLCCMCWGISGRGTCAWEEGRAPPGLFSTSRIFFGSAPLFFCHQPQTGAREEVCMPLGSNQRQSCWGKRKQETQAEMQGRAEPLQRPVHKECGEKRQAGLSGGEVETRQPSRKAPVETPLIPLSCFKIFILGHPHTSLYWPCALCPVAHLCPVKAVQAILPWDSPCLTFHLIQPEKSVNNMRIHWGGEKSSRNKFYAEYFCGIEECQSWKGS